jgi:hypothetical protein
VERLYRGMVASVLQSRARASVVGPAQIQLPLEAQVRTRERNRWPAAGVDRPPPGLAVCWGRPRDSAASVRVVSGPGISITKITRV